MSDNEEINLFGEISAEEQVSLDELKEQMGKRQHEEALRCSVVESANSRLEFQRRRYLQSARQHMIKFETLRDNRPMNFGQVFTSKQCQEILEAIYDHVASQGWTLQRHGAFPTRDVPVKSLSVSAMVYTRLAEKLFPKLELHTGIGAGYWTFRDLFVVGYHEDHQRMLKLHTDGCLASLTLLLNNPAEFTGGGTFFKKFDLHIKQKPGEAWVHDAKLSHSGMEITSGKRIVMVAFMDTTGGITEKIAY
ncbi:hypothetical protein J3B02_002644 [Coemansia erecta]|uniref:Prolyl 4-hydroxylase alpha subunit domain-containing protein n=1 Tax=Coemansia asiatica TaxID=1052880 RepID=A0A9W7XJB8_9FUNG|nr:hypothetical protein LPJ64_003681 [Coemansia asiatica]KAJ2854495.1 hypothetical protein J3B02_002644 [Coemansia erecta]KAJ2888688.1 hypothetical protein FB639_000464 [Coemansia asiatica]